MDRSVYVSQLRGWLRRLLPYPGVRGIELQPVTEMCCRLFWPKDKSKPLPDLEVACEPTPNGFRLRISDLTSTVLVVDVRRDRGRVWLDQWVEHIDIDLPLDIEKALRARDVSEEEVDLVVSTMVALCVDDVLHAGDSIHSTGPQTGTVVDKMTQLLVVTAVEAARRRHLKKK
jgi:hypothetical protein